MLLTVIVKSNSIDFINVKLFSKYLYWKVSLIRYSNNITIMVTYIYCSLNEIDCVSKHKNF